MTQVTPAITILRDPSDPLAFESPVTWAIDHLQHTFSAKGVAVQRNDSAPPLPREERGIERKRDSTSILITSPTHPTAQRILSAAGVSLPDAPESLALVHGAAQGQPVLLATGSDVRGLVYAILEIADRVACAEDSLASLQIERPLLEQPANPIRSIMRLFASDVEDKSWYQDKSFWPPYLTELATQRFNRFNLALGLSYDFPRHVRDAYFYFAYPFLLDVPGYDVRVTNLSIEERDRNLVMLRYIGEEVKRRGLHFQLGIWTHAYEWIDSPEANHTIQGLNAENHAAYCRDAVRLLLESVPTIDGITFRIHGESGVPEQSYDFWRTVFEGVATCGRRVEIDMHAKGIDQRMIDTALETGLPVNVSAKYWAEHMGPPYHQAAIRPLEQPTEPKGDRGRFMALSEAARRFTRYGYGDLLREDRRYGLLFRIWPGTQRLLLWGDPAMAAGYGHYSHFAASLGTELFEPLSFKGRRGSGLPDPRGGYADESLRPAEGDWAKYRYTYRLFGRLLYDPEAAPETWRRWSDRQFGPAAAAAEQALASASRILPLVTVAHLPSAANNSFWPEIYTNMSIVDENRAQPYGDTPSPKRFGTVSPLDPELFSSIEEFAAEIVSGERSAKYTPLDVARWLDTFTQSASDHLAQVQALTGADANPKSEIANPTSPEVRRWQADIAIQVSLGRFFANKFRAGVAYALFTRTQHAPPLREGMDAYRQARAAWAEAAAAGRVYVDDLTFGPEPKLRGHWAGRLDEIDADISALEAALDHAQKSEREGRAAGASGALTLDVLAAPPRPQQAHHTPPERYIPGAPLEISLSLPNTGAGEGPGVVLHYRHVDQSERWHAAEMRAERTGSSASSSSAEEGRYHAEIPAAYTDSPYPLQYYFEVRPGQDRPWLHPGFDALLTTQPYFLVIR